MTIVSPFPDVDIPNVTIGEYVFGSISEADCNRVAVVGAVDGSSLTYGELVTQVGRFANGLFERGIRVGDVVGLLLPNSLHFVAAFYGVVRVGAAATLMNPLASVDDVTKQLRDSGARVLITVEALQDTAEKALAAVSLVEQLIILDGSGRQQHSPYCNMADLLNTSVTAPAITVDPASHVAVILYSSGTTGLPKGVMLTHRNLVANLAQVEPLSRLTTDDTILAAMPFFHSYGLAAQLNTGLKARCRVIIMSRFEFTKFLDNIQTHRCTRAFIGPSIALAVAHDPTVDSYDLTSLRTLISAAAPLDEATAASAAIRAGCRVVQVYGLTELSPASHVVPFDGGARVPGAIAPAGSCGWTVANSCSKIVDPLSGREVAFPRQGLSEAGELWFKGPNVMAGYLNNETATAEIIDEEGWLHTGDLARIDAHGCVYIVDRIKELIKYKGYQVAPAELEALLLTHPGVADAAVVGVRDNTTSEELPKAFIVKSADTDVTPEQIISYIARRVAPYKKIRLVEFVDSIPRSAAGKILRRHLRQPIAAV
jgi:acyl-CoA synthetase (AMP-forming)/AMP-acid ligase II